MKPETQSFYARAVERAVDEVLDGSDRALDLESLARRAALFPVPLSPRVPRHVAAGERTESAVLALPRLDESIVVVEQYCGGRRLSV